MVFSHFLPLIKAAVFNSSNAKALLKANSTAQADPWVSGVRMLGGLGWPLWGRCFFFFFFFSVLVFLCVFIWWNVVLFGFGAVFGRSAQKLAVGRVSFRICQKGEVWNIGCSVGRSASLGEECFFQRVGSF